MESAITRKNTSLKCGTVIKILSLTALVCTALSCLSYFFYYDSTRIDGEWVYEFDIYELYDWNLRRILSFILTLAPVVLLALYIFKFHSKLKATSILPIIFGIFSFEIFFNFLTRTSYYSYTIPYGVLRIIDLVILVLNVLAVISALKGLNKKIFVVLAMSICLFYQVLCFFDTYIDTDISYCINHSLYLYLFIDLMSFMGSSALYTALLLFGLKNRIPSIIYLIYLRKEKKKPEILTPEQALRLLKDKYDLDMITEEEYQAERADIISKL